LQTGKCLHTLEGHSVSVNAMAITPNGKQALSASGDETLKLWDLNSSKCLAIWGGEFSLICCAVSPSLNSIAVIAGEESGRVHILQLEGVK
jgi:WD40 repeat protein